MQAPHRRRSPCPGRAPASTSRSRQPIASQTSQSTPDRSARGRCRSGCKSAGGNRCRRRLSPSRNAACAGSVALRRFGKRFSLPSRPVLRVLRSAGRCGSLLSGPVRSRFRLALGFSRRRFGNASGFSRRGFSLATSFGSSRFGNTPGFSSSPFGGSLGFGHGAFSRGPGFSRSLFSSGLCSSRDFSRVLLGSSLRGGHFVERSFQPQPSRPQPLQPPPSRPQPSLPLPRVQPQPSPQPPHARLQPQPCQQQPSPARRRQPPTCQLQPWRRPPHARQHSPHRKAPCTASAAP